MNRGPAGALRLAPLKSWLRALGAATGAPMMAAALASCAAWTPAPPLPPLEPVALPADWSAGTHSQQGAAGAPVPLPGPPRAWWQRFGDPQLDALVARALQANPGLASARAALAQAHAVRDQAAAALAPAVSASVAVQRDRTTGQPLAGSNTGSLLGSWDPDWSGARHAALRASEAEATAAAWTLDDAQLTLVAETASTYVALRGAQLRMAIARANLANQNETAQITAWRTQAGLLTSLENEQARAAREQAAAQVPALAAQIEQLIHSLSILCGRAPADLRAQLVAAAAVPDPGLPLDPPIPAEALRARADVRAAEARLQAALARVAQADAARKPGFQLEGHLSWRRLTPGTGGTALIRTLLGSVAGDVFDGGAGVAAVRGQRAALQQAQAGYRAAVLQALAEAEDSMAAISADRARLGSLSAAAEAASNAALLARDRYASGLVDFQTVLETQRNLFARQDEEAATRIALATDHIRLSKALGGAWPLASDVPAATAAAPMP